MYDIAKFVRKLAAIAGGADKASARMIGLVVHAASMGFSYDYCLRYYFVKDIDLGTIRVHGFSHRSMSAF